MSTNPAVIIGSKNDLFSDTDLPIKSDATHL